MNEKPIEILLIEDDLSEIKVIQLMLASQREQAAFNVLPCRSLAAGLEALSKNSIDAVLLDLNLPDSRGLETFTTFHAAYDAVPVIVISGDDSLSQAVQAVQMGAQDYLLKGEMSRNLLVRSVYHAIERHSILEKLNRQAQEVANSEARWRMIADKSADGIAIVDAEGGIQFANPAAIRMLKIADSPEAEQIFSYPLTMTEVTELTIVGDETQADIIVEMETVPVEWNFEAAYLVILRDITARKRVEIELQQAKDTLESVVKARTSELNKANQYLLDQISERRRAQRQLNRALAEAEQARDQIDTIFASVADGLLATDRYNRITMMNHAAEEILEITWANAIGQLVESVVNNATLLNRILTTLETGQDLQFEFEMPSPAHSDSSPSSKIIRARSSVVKDSTHKSSGVITVMYDVTREREVDRLKAEFISTAAHELRTPLTTVQGFSEILLARDDFPPEAQKKYLSYINNQAVALARIVDDLLDIARFESGRKFVLNKEPVMIRDMLEAVIARFELNSSISSPTSWEML